MKRKELLWMLLPCLLFVGVALWMRAREAKLPPGPPDDGTFRLFIEKIETRPITAKDAAEGYDTEVAVILNHTGPTPNWWVKHSSSYGSADNNARLWYEGAGNQKPSPVKLPPHFKKAPPIFYWRPGWKSETKRYEARFFLPLSKLPPRSEKTVLRAKIFIEDGTAWPHKALSNAVPFSFTVREAKAVVKPPPVSRDPLLRIIKTEITKPTPAQQKTNGGYDSQVKLYLQDLGPLGAGGSTHGSDSVVDEKGNPVYGGTGQNTLSGVRTENPRRPVLNFDCVLRAYPRSQRNVFVKMKYSQSGRWPLVVRVPLRLNGKDLKGAVTAVPLTVAP